MLPQGRFSLLKGSSAGNLSAPFPTRAHFISNIRKQHMALQDNLTYKQTSQQSVAGLCVFISQSTQYLIVSSRLLLKASVCNFFHVKILQLQEKKVKSMKIYHKIESDFQ